MSKNSWPWKKKNKEDSSQMSDANSSEKKPEDIEVTPESEGAAEEATEAEESKDPAAELQAKCGELQDKNQRLAAELQNARKRAEREQSEALKYAESDFARELLVILDDFERTLESVKTTEDAKAVVDGVRIIYEHFQKVLKGRNIEPIEALGQPFDPTYHEAMLQQPSEEHEAGIVMQEITKGYKMHGRVIRHTRVIVSSGAPAQPEPPAPDDVEDALEEE